MGTPARRQSAGQFQEQDFPPDALSFADYQTDGFYARARRGLIANRSIIAFEISRRMT
jgi:hypothetical protein